jgi:capsule polysaccharide export protein KpsE/RkpR
VNRDTNGYFDPAGLKLIALLWHWRKFIAVNVLIVMVLSAAVALMLPNIYRAKATIFPPKKSETGGLSARAMELLGSIGPVGFASAGLSTSSSDLLAAVLRSRRLSDMIVEREALVSYYKVDTPPEARRQLEDALSITVEADGLVVVQAADENAEKAASIAGAALAMLDSLNRTLSTTAAAATRRFVEERLANVESDLASAEEGLRAFQEKTGSIAIEKQVGVMLQSLASLRVERMRQEMDLALLQNQLEPGHRRILSAKERLADLDRQIRAAESTEDSTVSLTAGNAPELALRSLRLLRQVTVYEKIYEFLRQQLEQARIEEMRDTPTFTILDPPVPPDRKWRPVRTFIVVGSAVITVVVFGALIVWAESTGGAPSTPSVGYASGWRTLVRRRRQQVG